MSENERRGRERLGERVRMRGEGERLGERVNDNKRRGRETRRERARMSGEGEERD